MNKHALIAIALGLALAGCSKKAAGPSCEPAITQGVDRMSKGPATGATITGKLKTIMIRRCTEDKWPAAVIKCYETVDSMAGMKKCREGLDPAASERLVGEIRTVMLTQGAGGGPPGGHGTPVVVPPGTEVPVSKVGSGAAPASASDAVGSAGSAAN